MSTSEQPSSDVPGVVRHAQCVAFAGITLIANSTLLFLYFRNRRHARHVTRTLYLMRQSLFFGGTLLSVSYLIDVWNMLMRPATTSCLTYIMVSKYENEMLPFFFGVSLAVQAVYLVLNFGQKVRMPQGAVSSMVTVVWVVLPGLFTLGIVFPLVFTGADIGDDDVCWNDGSDWTTARRIAVEVVCGIIPSCLALLCSIVAFFKISSRLETTPDSMKLAPLTRISTISSPDNERVVGMAHGKSPGEEEGDLERVGRQQQAMEERPRPKSLKVFSTGLLVSFVFAASVLPSSIYFVYASNREVTSRTLTLTEIFAWLKHVYPIIIPFLWIRNI